MPQKKNQHFVPKFYLKQFSNDNGMLNIFLLKSNELVKCVPYSNQCQIDYYYGKDTLWEDKLGDLESDSAPIFRRMVEDELYYPSELEISILRRFVIYQRSRTTAFNELADEQRLQTAAEGIKISLEHKGIPYTDEILHDVIKARLDADSDIIHSNLEIARDVGDKIDDLSFVIINCSENLVASDNPVILVNPFVPSNIGYATIGLIILFPIGPKNLGVFYDSKMYPDLCTLKRIICTNENDIELLNAYQFILGKNILFGTIDTTFQPYTDPSNKYLAERKRVLERDATTIFGEGDHKLVISSPPTILLKNELSFCRMLSDAKKIPFPCREPIPRYKEDGYLEKIRIKNEMMPFMMEQMKRPFDSAKRKEFRQGTQRMERLANLYWKL